MIAELEEPAETSDVVDAGAIDLAPVLMQVLLHGIYAVRAVLRKPEAGDLTMPQFRLLVALTKRSGASLCQAAEVMGLSAPAASRLVDGLVGRALVTREELASDRRRVSLALTPAGAAVLDGATAAVLAHLRKQLAPLADEQRAPISATLALLDPLLAPAARAADGCR